MVECGGAFHGWSWLGRGRALVNTFMLAKAQKRVNGKRVLFCILREILGSEVGIGFSTGRSKSPKPIMLIQSNLAFGDASPLRLTAGFAPGLPVLVPRVPYGNWHSYWQAATPRRAQAGTPAPPASSHLCPRNGRRIRRRVPRSDQDRGYQRHWRMFGEPACAAAESTCLAAHSRSVSFFGRVAARSLAAHFRPGGSKPIHGGFPLGRGRIH